MNKVSCSIDLGFDRIDFLCDNTKKYFFVLILFIPTKYLIQIYHNNSVKRTLVALVDVKWTNFAHDENPLHTIRNNLFPYTYSHIAHTGFFKLN